MFRKRNAPNLPQRIKDVLWPKKGFIRAWKYVGIRLLRLNTSPHAIAAGFASGAAISFTPLLGLHIILAFVLSFITRGSMLAAVFGTVVGNPITFPLFFSATYWVGAHIRDIAAGEPAKSFRKTAQGSDHDAEADAAADAVLDAAEDIIEGGSSFAALDMLWPVVSTMLIGALVLVPIAYAVFYFAARTILYCFDARNRR